MKKMMLLLMVAMATSAFGINSKVYGVFSKMNNESTLKYITTYLNADDSQTAELETIFDCTDKLLKSAEVENTESLAASAVNYNLSSMKSVLTSSQFRKYLVLVNMSISNIDKNLAITNY